LAALTEKVRVPPLRSEGQVVCACESVGKKERRSFLGCAFCFLASFFSLAGWLNSDAFLSRCIHASYEFKLLTILGF
jgi:hypothetical protein